jgi:hypothetical protein
MHSPCGAWSGKTDASADENSDASGLGQPPSDVSLIRGFDFRGELNSRMKAVFIESRYYPVQAALVRSDLPVRTAPIDAPGAF